jgi:hypothetical protein
MAVSDVMLYLSAAKSALDLFKGIKSELPHGPKADEVQKKIEKAEQALEVSDVDLKCAIRDRAIDRGGQLLEQEKRERGKNQHSASGRTKLKEAIEGANLTPAEARTMIIVARVPAEQFREVGRARQSGVA